MTEIWEVTYFFKLNKVKLFFFVVFFTVCELAFRVYESF